MLASKPMMSFHISPPPPPLSRTASGPPGAPLREPWDSVFGPSQSPADPELSPAYVPEPPSPRISNRQIPELESLVSHRKQRIGPISNRHIFAFCNFRLISFLASLPPRFFASSHSLIANDMHSRKMPSRCKHSTYEFLIANENQRAALTLSEVEGSFALLQALTLNSKLSTHDSLSSQRSACN